jgi:hypothetical protein
VEYHKHRFSLTSHGLDYCPICKCYPNKFIAEDDPVIEDDLYLRVHHQVASWLSDETLNNLEEYKRLRDQEAIRLMAQIKRLQYEMNLRGDNAPGH